ncbi:hypothetical protein PG995_004414 [Apiospora arundinis]
MGLSACPSPAPATSASSSRRDSTGCCGLSHVIQNHLDPELLEPGDVGRARRVDGDATGRRRVFGQYVGERRFIYALCVAHIEGVSVADCVVELGVISPSKLLRGEVHVATDHGDPRGEIAVAADVLAGNWTLELTSGTFAFAAAVLSVSGGSEVDEAGEDGGGWSKLAQDGLA